MRQTEQENINLLLQAYHIFLYIILYIEYIYLVLELPTIKLHVLYVQEVVSYPLYIVTYYIKWVTDSIK